MFPTLCSSSSMKKPFVYMHSCGLYLRGGGEDWVHVFCVCDFFIFLKINYFPLSFCMVVAFY